MCSLYIAARKPCVLQCVAVCCSVLQRGAVCCSVLQCVAVLQRESNNWNPQVCSLYIAACKPCVLQCVAVLKCVLQCLAVSCSVAMCNWHLKPTGMLTLHRRTQALSLISRAIDTYTYIRIHVIRIYTCEHAATHYNTLKQAFSLISRVLMREENCFTGLVRDF